MKRLEIKPYNEKSFIVVGSETKSLSQQLKSLGGRFCFLPASEPEHEGYYQPSWVFSINKYEKVIEQLEALLATTKQPATKQPAKKEPAVKSKPAKTEQVKQQAKKEEPAKTPIRIKPISF